jgi:hypothetical protein
MSKSKGKRQISKGKRAALYFLFGLPSVFRKVFSNLKNSFVSE